MANYKLNEEAEDDIRQLYRYGILNFGLEEADRWDGLFERFEKLAENPYLFRVVDYIRTGYRRSVYRRHSIYYGVGLREGIKYFTLPDQQFFWVLIVRDVIRWKTDVL